MKFRAALLPLMFAIAPAPGFCQRPSLQVLAGMALNGVVPGPTTTRYTSVFLPRAGAGFRIPLSGRVAVLTGLDLQQKGFRNSSTVQDDSPGNYTIIEGGLRYTVLNIPMQLCVEAVTRKHWALEIAAGMSYGFMLKARGYADWNFYRKNIHIHTEPTESQPKITLLPYDNRLALQNQGNYGALYLFNPAFAASFTLRAKEHFLLQGFAECNLYDVATVSDTRLNLYSFGLCLGYRL